MESGHGEGDYYEGKTPGSVDTDHTLTDITTAAVDALTSRGIVDAAAISDLDIKLDRTVTAGVARVEVMRAMSPMQRATAEGRQLIAEGQRRKWKAIRALEEGSDV
jgi:hypothetical protein